MADRVDGLTPEKQGLKIAARGLVRAVGGQEACPAFGRYTRHQAYSEFASIEHADKFMPIDVVADLEAVTHGMPGHPHVTRKLCELAGGAFVRLPEAVPMSGGWHDAMGALTKEFSDVSTGLCRGLADGHLSAADIVDDDLIGQGRELIAVAVNIVAMLERAARADGGARA